MNNRDVEKTLRDAVEKTTPNVLPAVLSGCKQGKGAVLNMKTKKNRWVRTIGALAAAFIVLVGGGYALAEYRSTTAIDSVVALDVNPSIALNLNAAEKVISVDAMNDDAAKVLGNMDLKGASMDVAVNALIGSMLRQGYISELKNSILVTVDNADDAKRRELEERLVSVIDGVLQGHSIEGAIMGQPAPASEKLTDLAKENNISSGKAALIERILEKDPNQTFEDLAALSVTELALLASSKQADMGDSVVIGSASEAAYIGREAARDIALSNAGVSLQDAYDIEVEFDREGGVIVYEVEFKAAGVEYDYDINATSGDIHRSNSERDDDYAPKSTPAQQPQASAQPQQSMAPQASASPAQGSNRGDDDDDVLINGKWYEPENDGDHDADAIEIDGKWYEPEDDDD